MDAAFAQILSALSVGAIAASKEVAGTAIKDSYNALKTLVLSLFEAHGEGAKETSPDANEGAKLSADEVGAVIAGLDPASRQSLDARVADLLAALNRPDVANQLAEDPRITVSVGKEGRFEYVLVNLDAASSISFTLGEGASAVGQSFTLTAGKGK